MSTWMYRYALGMITVLCGGVGAARLLSGLVHAVDPTSITAIVNTGDDFVLHGLHISPDIDTIRYTLSDDVGELGWGRAGETWRAMDALDALAAQAPSGSRASSWFRLGDTDLAIHLYRTQRLREGATLSLVTSELAKAANIGIRMLPATDDRLATMVTLGESGLEVDFQEYFVKLHHEVAVTDIRFDGIGNSANDCAGGSAGDAKPAPGVIDAIERAERIIVAPSNPLVSIGPILAIPAISEAVKERRDNVIAVSPIVGGGALKGPADRMLVEMGHERSAAGVARLWSPFASTLVIDFADKSLAPLIEDEAMRCVTTSTVMSSPGIATALARDLLHLPLPI